MVFIQSELANLRSIGDPLKKSTNAQMADTYTTASANPLANAVILVVNY